MIEIKINGIQAECKFDCTNGQILSDDIHRVLIALYRVVCKATNDETADKAMQYHHGSDRVWRNQERL